MQRVRLLTSEARIIDLYKVFHHKSERQNFVLSKQKEVYVSHRYFGLCDSEFGPLFKRNIFQVSNIRLHMSRQSIDLLSIEFLSPESFH